MTVGKWNKYHCEKTRDYIFAQYFSIIIVTDSESRASTNGSLVAVKEDIEDRRRNEDWVVIIFKSIYLSKDSGIE